MKKEKKKLTRRQRGLNYPHNYSLQQRKTEAQYSSPIRGFSVSINLLAPFVLFACFNGWLCLFLA